MGTLRFYPPYYSQITLNHSKKVYYPSLRAEVNLAAVNYHFGSKEGLFQAVLTRRLEPLLDECLAQLADLQAQPTPLTVHELVAAMTQPFLNLAQSSPGGASFVHLLSRMLADDYPLLQAVSVPQYGEFIRGFTAAFEAALPHLNRTQLDWRLSFGLLVMLGAFPNHNDTLRVFLYSDIAPALDAHAAANELIPFVVARLAG